MRKLIFIVMVLMIVGIAGSMAPVGSVSTAPPQDLRSYVDKYPSALLQGMPSLRARMKAVLGSNYTLFMARIQTEMPIEEVEGCLVVVGCMAHSCGSEDAVMVIDLRTNKLHCAIRSNRYNGGYKVFSEDKSNIPHALYRMMEQY